MKITMKQIAQQLNISTVAVHRALTNEPGLSEELRRQILKTAESLGYCYNNRRLLRSRSFLFLTKRFYFLDENEKFYSSIYRNLERLCLENDAKLLLHLFENNEEKKMIEQMVYDNKKISGIFVSGQFPFEDMQHLAKLPLPVVVIDYYCPVIPLNYVYLPSYNDAYRLTYYAISHGHRELGYIGHLKENATLTDRFFGFRKALMDFKLPFKHEWVITEKVEDKAFFSTALPQKLPTVFLCHCDLTAKKLINALQLQKIRVPRDVSILSFDNNETALETDPTLTSMGIEKLDFARQALLLMQKKLKNPNFCESIRLESKIFERDSFCDLTE